MALTQTRYLLVGLALALLFVVYELQSYRYPARPSAIDRTGYYSSLPKSNDGSWRWTDRKIQHPLRTLVSLPQSAPSILPRVQHDFGTETEAQRTVRLERREAVRQVFVKCWRSYRSRAWMKDEVLPLSGGGRNTFGGWAATLVDSLDTLWIMDLKAEFQEAADAATAIDFSTSAHETINIFETTIRYLGGFLAAYDLSGDIKILHKAIEVGEMLLVPFDTPNHMPIARWNWQHARNGGRQDAPPSILAAEIGSLSLEFTRLSQLTGDPRWYDAIDRITRALEREQYNTQLPGMWPVSINARSGDMSGGTSFTLGGMADSLYEYLPKQHALLGGLEPVYIKMFEGSMVTAEANLFFRPRTPQNYDILMSGDLRTHGGSRPPTLDPKNHHLTCFVGGMFALGGRLMQNETYITLAKELTEGCVWAYNATSIGVMPETASFVACPSKKSCTWSEESWKAAVAAQSGHAMIGTALDDFIASKRLAAGYTQISDTRYILRPEAIESVFYMYRVTGDRTYLEHAWQMFSAIQRMTETELANAAIVDITATGADGLPPKDDSMESFWLAETLKYAFLIFSEPSLISLDDYVLNTEAHPFKRPG